MTTDLFESLDDPMPYTPTSGLTDRARTRGRQLRRRRRLGLGAASVPVVLVLALVASAIYIDRRTVGVTRVDIAAGELAPTTPGQPYNILLVGTDTPDVAGYPATPGGVHSDTILVVHVDEAGGRLSVLSLPRDLVFPGATSGADRLSEVLPRSGPSGLIAAIHDHLGIEISHYIAVDFRGFTKLVDAAGGLSVQASTPMRDLLTGMSLDGSCQHLDGSQALGLARSRHLEYQQNGRWTMDPTGDLGRISRERLVLRLLMSEVTQMPDDLGTLNQLLDVFADNTTIDTGFSRATLFDLARWGRSIHPDALDSVTLPTEASVLPDGSEVLMAPLDAPAAIQAFEHGQPTTPAGYVETDPGMTSIAAC